jgi:dsRNA-specific ribonuclease
MESHIHVPSWVNHPVDNFECECGDCRQCVNSLYNKIHEIVCNVSKKYEALGHDHYVDISHHCEWIAAFTHKSITSNKIDASCFHEVSRNNSAENTSSSVQNNALMTISGAFLIQFMFVEYLHSRFEGQLTQQNITLLTNKYAGSRYLVLLANKLGLMEFVHRDIFATRLDEDVIMKSFFYCLHSICEVKSLYGGYRWCFFFIKWLYDDVEMDVNIQQDYVSQLKCYHERNSLKYPRYMSTQLKDGWVIKIKGYNNKIIGVGSAVTKKDAKMNAAKSALANL